MKHKITEEIRTIWLHIDNYNLPHSNIDLRIPLLDFTHIWVKNVRIPLENRPQELFPFGVLCGRFLFFSTT